MRIASLVPKWLSRLKEAGSGILSVIMTPRTEPFHLFPAAIRHILKQPDAVEILSIDPADHENGDPPGRFDGHAILGRVNVKSLADRRWIGHSLIVGNRHTGPSFKCFDPYIGVIVDRGGERVTLAACFWCGNVAVSGPGPSSRIYPLSGWTAAALERQLKAAGIAIPKHEV